MRAALLGEAVTVLVGVPFNCLGLEGGVRGAAAAGLVVSGSEDTTCA